MWQIAKSIGGIELEMLKFNAWIPSSKPTALNVIDRQRERHLNFLYLQPKVWLLSD